MRRFALGLLLGILIGGPALAWAVAYTAGGGGAAVGAPTDAEYIVTSLNATLTAERRLQSGDGIIQVDGGANGDITLNVDLNATADGVGSTGNLSGLEFTATNELALLQGCADTNVLAWVSGTSQWDCTAAVGGAPTGASYIVAALDATLTAERRLQGTANEIELTDGGANGDMVVGQPDTVVFAVGANPDIADGASLGTSTLEFFQLFLGNSTAALQFGLDNSISLGSIGAGNLLLDSGQTQTLLTIGSPSSGARGIVFRTNPVTQRGRIDASDVSVRIFHGTVQQLDILADQILPVGSGADAVDLGGTANEWNQLFLGDSATALQFGITQDVSMGWDGTDFDINVPSGASVLINLGALTTNPGLAFDGDEDTGFSGDGGGSIATVHNGSFNFVMSPSVFRTNIAGTNLGTATVNQHFVDAYFNDQILMTTAGADADPSYSWDGDPDTGMHNSAADRISLTSGGVSLLLLSESATAGSDEVLFANEATIRMQEISPTQTPALASLTADGEVAVFTESDCLVFGYNDGGVLTFAKLALDGSAAILTHDTTDPTAGCAAGVDDDIPEAGDYTNLTGGDGIINSPTGTIAVDLNATLDGVGSTGNLSGLEFTATGELALLQGCAEGDVLDWNDTAATWDCAAAAGGAPTNAQYVVMALNGSLSDERRLQGSDAIALTDGGANGDATLDFDYTATLAGNPALAVDECIFSTDGTGGGILCEGSITGGEATIEGLLVWNPSTSDRTLTLPDATDILVARDTTDTLTNKTLDSTNTVQAGAYAAASIDGDDIASGIAGDGLILTAAAPDTLDIDLNATADGTGATSNLSGMEFTATSELALLQGCANDEILKWVDATSQWGCAADAGAAGGDSTFVNTTATTDFDITDSGVITWTLNTTPSPDQVTATFVEKRYVAATVCNEGSVGANNLSTESGNKPTARNCLGTAPHIFGVFDLDAGTDNIFFYDFLLPSDWDSATNIDVDIFWHSTSTSSNNVVWGIQTVCIATGEDLISPTYNSIQTVTDANNTTADTLNIASFTNLTKTGCAAGERMWLQMRRDADNASDNLSVVARMQGIEITYRRSN